VDGIVNTLVDFYCSAVHDPVPRREDGWIYDLNF
jgi:hypothetical protein